LVPGSGPPIGRPGRHGPTDPRAGPPRLVHRPANRGPAGERCDDFAANTSDAGTPRTNRLPRPIRTGLDSSVGTALLSAASSHVFDDDLGGGVLVVTGGRRTLRPASWAGPDPGPPFGRPGRHGRLDPRAGPPGVGYRPTGLAPAGRQRRGRRRRLRPGP